MKTAILAALALVCVTLNAEARPRSVAVDPNCNVTMPCDGVYTTSRGRQIERAMPFGKAVQRYQPSSLSAPSTFISGRLICARNVNAALAERGIRGTGSALAYSFLRWGGAGSGQAGDVAVFGPSRRGGHGHVAIVAGRDESGRILYLNPSSRRQAWQIGPYGRQPIAFRSPS